jgi:hypothetical protein
VCQLRKSGRVIKRHIDRIKQIYRNSCCKEPLNRQRQDHVTPTSSQSADDSNKSARDVEKEVIDVSSDKSQYLDVSGTIFGMENEGFEAPVALESILENRIGRNYIVSTGDLRGSTESSNSESNVKTR